MRKIAFGPLLGLVNLPAVFTGLASPQVEPAVVIVNRLVESAPVAGEIAAQATC